jgi:hypothetical protein
MMLANFLTSPWTTPELLMTRLDRVVMGAEILVALLLVLVLFATFPTRRT